MRKACSAFWVSGCLVLLAAAAPARAGWQAAVTLSRAGADPPRVGIDARGDAIAVWDENTGATGAGVYGFDVKAALRPAGGVWQAPVTIGTATGVPGPFGGVASPQASVAVDQVGDAVVVWGSTAGFPTRTLWAAVKRAAGAWRQPVRLSGPAGLAGAPQVALDQRGGAAVVWSSDSGIRAVFGTVAGGFGKAIAVPGGRYGYDSQLGLDARGDALVVWPVLTSHAWVLQAALKPAGAAWRRPVSIGTMRGEGAGPDRFRAAFDSRGDAIVVWQHATVGSYGDVLQAAFRPAGKRWRKPVTRPASGVRLRELQMAFAPRGEVTVVWERESRIIGRRESYLGIQAAGFSIPANRWRRPVNIKTAADYLRPKLAADPHGNALVLWMEPGGAVRAASRPAGGGWQVPVTVASGYLASVAQPVDAAFDAHDNAIAVWGAGLSASNIEAASFTAGGG